MVYYLEEKVILERGVLMFLFLAGGLLVIIFAVIAVVAATVCSVAAKVATNFDEEE